MTIQIKIKILKKIKLKKKREKYLKILDKMKIMVKLVHLD